MKILITGATGFIGRNLDASLIENGYNEIFKFNTKTSIEDLKEFTKKCDFIYHLAAVHRPKNELEFEKINRGLTEEIINLLAKYKNYCPVLFSSSIQAATDTPYGNSKRETERIVLEYAKETGAKAVVYRLPNIFGKWGTPNKHSVIATFCYNIARELPIKINNPDTILNLCYIDNVVKDFIDHLTNEKNISNDGLYHIEEKYIHSISLRDIANKLYYFKACLENDVLPKFETNFDRDLYTTYKSYMPVKINDDDQRGQ